MNIDEKYKNELIAKYRNELFETENVSISEIDSLISNDDLKMMFSINNAEMCELINKKPLDKDTITKLLVANINLFKLAKSRDIKVYGTSFLMTIASAVDYNADKLYDELTVGQYNRPFKTR